MMFLENIRLALESLLVNRLRAALTTLGIIIGVGAVIALISLGRGVEDFIKSEFEDVGSNLIVAFSSPPTSPTRERIEPLTTIEAADLADPTIAPNVLRVSPIHGLQGPLVGGGESLASVTSFGVLPNYTELRNYEVRVGRWFTQQDMDDKARVLILGHTVAEELFGEDANPVGEIVRFDDVPLTVIAVMEEAGDLTGEDDTIFIPMTTSQQRLAPPFRARTRDGGYFIDFMYLQAASDDVMDEAEREIETYLNEAHNVQFDGEQDFTIINQQQILESLSRITGLLTIFLSLIASTSLVVGGIGIMNIMLVTVTERTKEIGLRKAVGAQETDILTQFLIESVVLSILGGAVGVLLGWVIAQVATVSVSQLELSVQLDSVILATGVSGFIGIFFGLYPAWRAARLRPIDALRSE